MMRKNSVDMQHKIKVIQTVDQRDCETCGSSYAEGGRIYIDEELVYEFNPHASCFNSLNMKYEDLMQKAFELIGYEMEYEYE